MRTTFDALAIAVQHHQAGQLKCAERIYRQILTVEPNHVDALHLLGVVASQVGNYEAAVEYIGRAISLKETDAAYHNNLGVAFSKQGKLDEAVACYCRALELNPAYAEAHNNLGNALKKQGNLDEAVACYRRALELNPAYAEAHNNIGVALKEQGKLDEAVACYRRALELNPGYAQAFYNQGVVLAEEGKPDAAIACYGRALELNPDYAEARYNRSALRLLTGDLEHGWPEYEWRWQRTDSSPRGFPEPIWDGGLLTGKTILLHAEQGLGDTIQFVRYAGLVKERGGTVILECQEALLSLLAGFPVDYLVGQGAGLPAFDVQAPLLSLPGIFKTTLKNIPADVPYLSVSRLLLDQWQKRLIKINGSKIGIAWQGNPEYSDDRLRSIPLRCFAPLAQVSGVHLISLQKGAGTDQLQELRDLFPVMDLASDLDERSGSFMDTAAVMKNLDLVITSDTSVAHLAGALGIPVWVALPFVPDWRWLLDRSDSPWYPTMRLFRQRERGNWQDVFEDIAKALHDRNSDGAK